MISVAIFGTVAVLFYYGVVLIVDENYAPGTVIMCVSISMSSLIQNIIQKVKHKLRKRCDYVVTSH